MSSFTFVFLASLFLFAGCGKKESINSTAPAEAPATSETATQPTGNPSPQSRPSPAPSRPNAANPGELPAEALVGTVHPFMTQQLQIFIQESGRMPKDFGEFASARMDSVPRLPPGLKYVVDTNTAQVKVVRK